jgi:hypothetical protein
VTGRVLLGATLFVLGAALWFFGRGAGQGDPPRRVRASIPRLGVALGSLGLSVMASAQPGVAWSVSSICFSLIAIVLLLTVVREALRR